MVRRWQSICHCDAENFERRDTGNIRRWRWWFNLTPSSRVGKDNLLRLVSVQRQIVCPCPRLDVVYLGRPRVDVAAWDDEVGVVSELAQLVAGSHRLQITRVDHVANDMAQVSRCMSILSFRLLLMICGPSITLYVVIIIQIVVVNDMAQVSRCISSLAFRLLLMLWPKYHAACRHYHSDCCC